MIFVLVVAIAAVNLALGYLIAVWLEFETFGLPRIYQSLKRRLPLLRKSAGAQQ